MTKCGRSANLRIFFKFLRLEYLLVAVSRIPFFPCRVFLTNLEGKVGKVGKVGRVGKVGKEGRLREKHCQSSTRFYSSLTKMVKKLMNYFDVEIWKKLNFGYRYLNSYRLSVFFKPNKVLT